VTTTTAPAQAHDELLPAKVAAPRLGVTEDYMYKNARKLPFTRRMGRKLLFSANGIDAYIRDGR
jgi:hypothetical protein